uniref:Uncharacterized protein n=1 Tax=Populus trichocarpa TaxID=3694 RepID=A0A3N7GA18_POPTR
MDNLGINEEFLVERFVIMLIMFVIYTINYFSMFSYSRLIFKFSFLFYH